MVSPPMEHTISENSIVVASRGQISADLDGETVILDLESEVYYSLDPVGTCIWTLIQEPRTVIEIQDAILQEYEVDPDRCEGDITALLEELAEAGLVEVRPSKPR